MNKSKLLRLDNSFYDYIRKTKPKVEMKLGLKLSDADFSRLLTKMLSETEISKKIKIVVPKRTKRKCNIIKF